MNSAHKKIVIIGAGFAGLQAARKLSSIDAEITLIDQNNYHLFQPLLYQVASAYLDPEQIAKPVRQIFRKQKNLTFRLAEVKDIDYSKKIIHTDSIDFTYDYLILAFGGTTNFYNLPGLEQYGHSLKTLEDAMLIRSHILSSFELAAMESNPEIRRRLLTITVGGGGPAGVEMAGSIAELIHQVIIKDYRELSPDDFKILLCEASDRILPDLPEDLARTAEKILKKKGVEVLFNTFIESYDGTTLKIKGKSDLPASTLIWTAGINAGGLSGIGPLETSANKRLKVNKFLQQPEFNEVYVIGDATYWEEDGTAVPMVAPAAVQMADTAAENIKNSLRGKQLSEFHYKSPGALATIGKNAAVAYIGGIKFRGFIAWLVWLVVHIIRLIGFRNKLVVLINWASDYFFMERASRLILKLRKKNNTE